MTSPVSTALGAVVTNSWTPDLKFRLKFVQVMGKAHFEKVSIDSNAS